MRIEQLEYLVAVTRYGSLRRASEHLHISQPAISEAVRKLEREFGITLLDRHRSGARISLDGRELLQPMVDVLESVERLKAATGDQLAARRLLRIGAVDAGAAPLLLPAVRAFQTASARAAVEVRTLQQDEIQVSLAGGTLDLGLVNLLDGDDVPAELAATPLRNGRPTAVLPAGHPLASRDAITADDLRAERFVAMRAGHPMHRLARRLFGSEPPASWHCADGTDMGKLMVAEGIGVTVLPDYSVLGDPLELAGLIVARPLTGHDTVITMTALHRRQARMLPALRQVLEHMRDLARRPLPAARNDRAGSGDGGGFRVLVTGAPTACSCRR